jgi:hypothetical protein
MIAPSHLRSTPDFLQCMSNERAYPDIAQLLIVLEGQRPWVWRRLHVSFFTKLGGLHRVLEAVMGWESRLPHQFVLAGDIYGRVAPNEALPPEKERNWRLDSALYPNHEFWYVVGGTEGWRHRIKLEDYVEERHGLRYPRCLDGAGASPSGAEETFSLAATNRRLWRQVRKTYVRRASF